MSKPKRTRRTKGPDGNLYTKEELNLKFDAKGKLREDTSVVVETTEHKKRVDSSKPDIQEKVSVKEKDTAPSLIISYMDSSGKRRTKTYQCSSIKLDEFKSTEMMRSGPKTTLSLSIEADVVEVL